ncbi:Kinase A inhibitor [compost metagenome]
MLIRFESSCSLDAVLVQLPFLWRACLKRARLRVASNITLGVVYGGRAAPYLRQLARQAGLHVDEWIKMHVSRPYTVLSVGVHPGFACLDELEPVLQRSVMANSREPVFSGGVAVSEFRTAVAASTIPAGWNLVGVISKGHADDGADLISIQPGDSVCFERVDVLG